MKKAKKYYWLKLRQDFFDNLRMKKLRSIAGGDTYTIIYLKMQLLSLQEEGYLFYEGVEESFEQEIALIINENVEDVKITIAFLKANGLLDEVEENKFELVETKTCIGSETDKAEFMRRLRKQQKQEKLENSNKVTPMLLDVTKCYTNIDINKDININKKENIKRKSFVAPTLDEINSYINEKGLNVDGKQFFDYFTEGKWVDSNGNRVKNWKQKLLTWNKFSKVTQRQENKKEFDKSNSSVDLSNLFEN